MHHGDSGPMGLEREDKNRGHEKVKVAEKKDQPDPPEIFPDQEPTHIGAAFNKHAKGRISDGPEPSVWNAEDSLG